MTDRKFESPEECVAAFDEWYEGGLQGTSAMFLLTQAVRLLRATTETYTVDGKPVVRVVIDVTVGSAADEQALAEIGEVLAERMGDNLDAVLGVNDLMIDHDVKPWWIRPELAIGENVTDPTLPNEPEDVEDVLMEGD